MTTQTENKLLTPEILDVFKDAEVRLESLRTKFQGSGFTVLNDFTELLARFTADFGFLSPLYQRFRAARENNEVQTYIQKKADIVASGNKFTSAPVEREARHSVSELVEVEKLTEGYKDAVEQAILTCKKIIEVQMLERQREAR